MHGLPSTTRTLLRGLVRRRPGLRDRSIPRIEAHASGVQVGEDWLDAYRALTDSPPSDFLPLMAPQLLAGPLHAQVLSDASMPVGVLGLVHVVQHIEQKAPIPKRAALAFDIWLEGHRPARQGAELDLHTRVAVDGEVLWTATSTTLARGPWKDAQAEGAPDEVELRTEADHEDWDAPSDIGRQWRRVSGDPNPIHLSRWLARPFGFKAAIAHGTWLVARAAGRLGEADGPATLHARFRRPVFLPSTPRFVSATEGDETHFRLRDPIRDKTHVEGFLRRGPTDRDRGSD